MSMRIGDPNPVNPVQRPAAGKRKEGASRQTGATQDDAVALSQLSRAVAEPESAPIEQLRLDVNAGSYEVPAPVLAKDIVDFHTE